MASQGRRELLVIHGSLRASTMPANKWSKRPSRARAANLARIGRNKAGAARSITDRHTPVSLAAPCFRCTIGAMPTQVTLAEIESIAAEINAVVPPTPQFSWPLLNARLGCELWVKHENHTAIGSFKIRGALNFINQLLARAPETRGVVAATRGNFGQAVAFAASYRGLSATIVVPQGNSAEGV